MAIRWVVLMCLGATSAFAAGGIPDAGAGDEPIYLRKKTADEIKEKLLDKKTMTENTKIPNAEKLKTSSQALIQMRADLKEVLGKLEEARGRSDVVKLTCVNEKLTQIKGLLRISEQADVTMQEAVARNESGAAAHEYTKVIIAQGKIKQLRIEAEQCMGQLAFRVDENMNIEVVTPEYLPKYDPTRFPNTLTLTEVRSVPASPTMMTNP